MGTMPVHRHLDSAYKYLERQLLRQERLLFSTNYVQKPTKKTKSVDAKKVMLCLNNKDIPDKETQK
jgi:hypothetical protein